MIWEEHPKYQAHQALMIGIGLLVLLVVCISLAVVSQDWDSLRQILLFAGAFIFVIFLFSGGAWFLVRIFTRKHTDDKKIGDDHA